MVKTVSDSDLNAIQAGIGKNSQIHAAAIARLYKANSSSSSWVKEAMGAVVIATLESENSHFLYLVDLQSKQTKFRQELYEKFSYQKPKAFFHTFEGDFEVVGFSFADESEANDFYDSVIFCCKNPVNSVGDEPEEVATPSVSLPPRPQAPPTRRPPAPVSPRPPPPSISPVSTPTPTPVTSSPSPSTYSAPSPPPMSSPPVTTTTSSNSSSSTPTHSSNYGTLKKSKSSGFLGKFSSISNFFKSEDPVADIPISEPRNFRHLSSIGWNPNEGNFEIRNIPPEWRKLFQQAGIKKSDLKNTNTAQAIMNIIESHSPVEDVPPPPPPMDDVPPPPGPGPMPSSSNARSGLLSQIQQGKALKPVEPTQSEKAVVPSNPNDLVSTLQKAMADRRPAFTEDQEEEWSNDGEWDS